jgi:cell division protease FtsH
MPKPANKPMRNLMFWISAGIIIILAWSLINNPAMAKKDVTFSQFMSEAEQGKVEEVTIQDNQLRGKFTDGQTFKTILPAGYTDLIKILRDSKVNIIVKDTSRSPLFTILMSWFPILLLILFWVFFMRQMQAGGNKAGPSSSPASRRR